MLKSTVRQYVASGACTMGVTMVAVGFIWLEPYMKTFIQPNSEIPMTTKDTSWLVAIIEISELFTTVPSGLLADRYGRKPILLLTGPLCFVGWVLLLTTRSLTVMYIVRLLQGIAVATVYSVGPMYIAEISEARIRGELSGHFQTQWYVGVLCIYVIGPLFEYQTYLYICASLPVLFMMTFIFVPESPYYYIMVGNHGNAEESLKWLRATDDVSEELKTICESVDREMAQKGTWTALFATKKDTKMFFIVQLVATVKYFNGMSAVISYAAESVEKGIGGDPYVLTILLGVVLCVTTTCSAFVSDSVGRRALLLWSAFGSALFNAVLGGYYYLVDNSSINMMPYSWVMLASMVGFCVATNMGLGPLMQTIQAEYFPINTRGIGGGVTGMTAAIVTFINLKQFQMLNDSFGLYSNYVVFALLSLIGYISFIFIIPETAGKTLGEIQGKALYGKPSNEDNTLAETNQKSKTIVLEQT